MASAVILVVEDEADIREVIEYNLKREGFSVLCAQNGEEGLELAQSRGPDLVLLDLMLPGIDGIELCRRLKYDAATRAIPVIMLTAKGEETDVVLGLGVGADDYVTKPFGHKELLARIRAVLRRGEARPTDDDKALQWGPIAVDADRHEVTIDGKPVTFTATEFRLLHYLSKHPGRVFTRDHLLTHAAGKDVVVLDRNIDVHVRSIRKKLGAHRDLIETIRGVGYRARDVRD